MKWLGSLTVAIVAASPIVGAANNNAMSATYVGCVEAGSMAGSFVLTHVAHQSMAKDGMMKGDEPAMGDMKMPMAPDSILLTGSVVSKKHVGRKVSVTGSETMGSQTSLAVKSVKIVAKSCS